MVYVSICLSGNLDSQATVEPGAIGVDGVQFGQVASRGAVGLVKSGKKTNAKNNFATAKNAPVRELAYA